MSQTNDSLVMIHGKNSFYISIFIYQQKKRSRSWRAGCHNGCTGYDSGVVRYWIVCWIGWHFVITLSQIWYQNDVIMLKSDVIMVEYDVIVIKYNAIIIFEPCSNPILGFLFLFTFISIEWSLLEIILWQFSKMISDFHSKTKSDWLKIFPDWLSWSLVDQIRLLHFRPSKICDFANFRP